MSKIHSESWPEEGCDVKKCTLILLFICARSQGNNPWQPQVMALFGAPLAPLAFSSGAGLLSPV
jgi:hypothetical protein